MKTWVYFFQLRPSTMLLHMRQKIWMLGILGSDWGGIIRMTFRERGTFETFNGVWRHLSPFWESMDALLRWMLIEIGKKARDIMYYHGLILCLPDMTLFWRCLESRVDPRHRLGGKIIQPFHLSLGWERAVDSVWKKSWLTLLLHMHNIMNGPSFQKLV